MASAKTYNEVDCKEQLLFIERTKGEYGGYRQDLLPNSLNEELIDFYICTKCNGLLRNACQVGADQNLACEMCVVEGETSQPMIKSRKKIPEIGAKCPLVSRGCVWKGIIGEVDAHLDVCNELIIECLNKCKVILKRSELTNHCENECRNRKLNCIHCKIVFQYKEIDNHLTVCPESPLLCPNECMETFLLKEMDSHIEKHCPNTIVLCSNTCGLKMKKDRLSTHRENECQHRIVSCEYCGVTLKYKELENHFKFCLEFPLVCPNECQRSLMRKELESHIEEECPNTLVACPYEEMGCDVVTKRCETQQHEKHFESNHLIITVIYYSDKVKTMETHFKDKERELKALTVEVRTLKSQLLSARKSKLSSGIVRLNEPWLDDPFPMYFRSKTTVGKMPESEVLPEKRDEHLKIGFLHVYVGGLLLKGWKRNLVALSDGRVHLYNTARDYHYGKNPASTLQMNVCDGIETYQNYNNGFAIRVAGKLHNFVAETTEEMMEWLTLLEESKAKHYKENPVKRVSVQ